MKKQKLDIENMPLSNVDLNLINDFINLYEDVQEKINEYNALCDEIRSDYMVKNELNKDSEQELTTALDRTRLNLINKMTKCKSEEELKELNEQIKRLQKTTRKLNQYDSILKIYNEKIYGKRFPKNYFNIKTTSMNKYQYIKQQDSTITQVYKYAKYLNEICKKLYDYKPEKKKKGLFSIIKTKIEQLKLKKTIKRVKQDYIKDNEMNIAQIDDTLFIDMDSLEQNFEYYKMFEEPISKFIIDNNNKITEARKQAEKEIDNEIIISNISEKTIEPEIVELSREKQIENLKQAKEELTKLKMQNEIPEEIIIPTKTA